MRSHKKAVDGPTPFPGVFVAALLLGVGLNPVNSTLISTALGPIATDFAVGAGSVQVLVTSLYLACSIAQPTAGKLSEQFGGRRVLLCGALLVLAGGLLGGLATDLATLTVARVVIGIGTSTGYPSAMLLVRRRAADYGLASAPKGVLAALAVVGLALMAIGPPIGGALVTALGWRSTFLVNVPVALTTVALVLVGIPRDAPVPRCGARELARSIDLVGIAGFACTMIVLLAFLFSFPSPAWVVLLAAIALGAVFVWWELRSTSPFFDVRALASNRPLILNYVRSSLAMLGSYVVLYGLPEWLEGAHGFASDAAGFVIVPMGIVSALVSTYVSSRGLVRSPFLAAGAGMAVGGVLMANLGDAGLPALALVASAALGITLGAAASSSQLVLYDQAEPAQMGVAAGLLRTFVYFGSIGASVTTAMAFGNAASDGGLHVIGWVVVALGVTVVAMTLIDHSLADS